MLSTITSMFKNKDIRNRIFFTLAMLFIFRFGTAITVPGVDTTSLTKSSNSLLDMINLLGGGGLEQMSILLWESALTSPHLLLFSYYPWMLFRL